MIKFANVIRATRNKPENFPKAAGLDILMLNSKGDVMQTFEFEPDMLLLSGKPAELSKFNWFLDKLESGLEDGSIPIDCLDGRLTNALLAVSHPQSFSEVFFR